MTTWNKKIEWNHKIPQVTKMEWKEKLYELSGGADDYGNCMVDVDKVIPVIENLLTLSESRVREAYKKGFIDGQLSMRDKSEPFYGHASAIKKVDK